MDASNSHHRQVDWYSGYKSVGVRNLNATHEKYLFRSLYTQAKALQKGVLFSLPMAAELVLSKPVPEHKRGNGFG